MCAEICTKWKVLGDCELLLNELNIDTVNPKSQSNELNEFIELIAVGCVGNQKPIMQKYRVLIVSGSGHSKKPEIEMVISLQNSKMKESNFL